MAALKYFVFKMKSRRKFLGLNPEAYDLDDDEYIMLNDLFDEDILVYSKIEEISDSDIQEANKRKLELVEIEFSFKAKSKGIFNLK